MKVLVVGGGGREHALVWKISQSPKVEKIYCAPGNGGISEIAECTSIKATDIMGIADFAENNNIDLTIVAPDDPLVLGLVDELNKRGLRAFGPDKKAALIEGSKVFSKDLMKKYNIPSPDYEVFEDYDEAVNYIINKDTYPIVIKADGLALGKGVIIADDLNQAKKTLTSILVKKVFGLAGSRVVIEEFITGPEVSVLTFTDGKTIKPMVSSQDHKRALDNDKGLNTGGMGVFTPSPHYNEELQKQVMDTILVPTMNAMNQEERKFKGVLYFGIMLTEQGPKVLEYNARFGDPETQVVLPRLENDIIDVFKAVIDERLDEVELKWKNCVGVCVILASGGYPAKYTTGYTISGLEFLNNKEDIIVFHSGTKKSGHDLVTNGGRVLGITAIGDNLDNARQKAYNAVELVKFKNIHFRRDIGIKLEQKDS